MRLPTLTIIVVKVIWSNHVAPAIQLMDVLLPIQIVANVYILNGVANLIVIGDIVPEEMIINVERQMTKNII
jgi:hypothetical protein